MKTMMILLFAGAMSASASLATTNDQWAEERLKAKTGRYSPVEEARRQTLARKSDGHGETCKKQNCCRHQHASAKDKLTGTPSTSADRQVTAKLCRSMAAVAESKAHEQTLAANHSSALSDAWWRSKWGRSMPHRDAETQTVALVASERSENVCERATCCD